MSNTLECMQWVLWAVEILAVLTLIAIGIDMLLGLFAGAIVERFQVLNRYKSKGRHRITEADKAAYREDQEKSAYEGFFEESYVAGIDQNGTEVWYQVMVPTQKALDFYREMDLLRDQQIFQNTEDL